MKKILYTLLWYIFSFNIICNADNAAWWIFGDSTGSLTKEEVRNWDIHFEDIPNIIRWIIDLLLWFAWTVAIIFIIIWAYKILFWSITQDKSKWKDTIIMALTWFAISSLARFIISFLISNIE